VFPVILQAFIREGEKMGKRIKEENCPFSAIAFFIGKGCPHFGPEGLIDYGSLCRNVDCLFLLTRPIWR
jgi:hypothetical protein